MAGKKVEGSSASRGGESLQLRSITCRSATSYKIGEIQMSITERFSKALTKSMFRAGYILVIVLVWQASLSPLMSQFGSSVQYFSQVGLNGGSTTVFGINNPSGTKTISVDVQLYFPNGDPLADGQVDLGPGATESLSFGDAQADLTSGWAELKSDDEFIATEFFQLSIAGQLKPRIGVLPSLVSDEIRFLGFVNPQFTSGLALSNPSSTEAMEVTLRVKDKTGQEPVGEKKVTLAPLECIAGFLNEEKFFGAALSNYEGVVEISTNSPGVAALAVLQAPSGDVTTVSVLTQDHIITTETNTALGIGALVSNTTGFENTATGASALGANTTGERNTASGDEALTSNTEGRSNTASGASALTSNTEGISNTAGGDGALFSNTTGRSNTASGVVALADNTTGSSNTAVGSRALRGNTTGSSNIALGFGAGRNLRAGDNNVYVGNPGVTAESNTIRIGTSIHTAFIAGVQLVPPSSRWFKQDIHDMDRASSDLMQLRPVTFRYKKEYDSAEDRLQFGLIAEEVVEVYPELVVYDDTGKVKTVEYQKLPAMLLNELQKQHGKIQEQEAVITDLTERLSRLARIMQEI